MLTPVQACTVHAMTAELPRLERRAPDVASAGASPRRRLTSSPWLPALTIASAVLSWVPIGFLVDASSPRHEEGMWFGYAFFGLLLALFAMVPLALTVITGIGGTLSRSDRNRWRWGAGGALVVLLASLPALLIGTGISLKDPYEADLAFFLPFTAITLTAVVFTVRAAAVSRPQK